MTDCSRVKGSFAAIVVLQLTIFMTTGSAQQPAPAALPAALPDAPQVLNTLAGKIRVVPIKGLVYPWALAFLPNGNILVTEQIGRASCRERV